MSEKLTKLEIDASTGTETISELTADEVKEYELFLIQSKKTQAEQDAKIAARQSALAKLAALGLTEEEIGAL